MAESSLPLWVILSIVGLLFSILVGNINYYLPSVSKLKAECLRKKPPAQRNNYILNLKRRIDEEYYMYIAITIYVIVSLCFCIENRSMLFNGEFIVVRIFLAVVLWLVCALIATSVLTGLMTLCQEDAVQKLKNHYQRHYGVIVINLDKKDEKAYEELSNN